MSKENKRFELVLPREMRAQVDELADSLSTTSSWLVRLGLTWVLADKELLLRGNRAENRRKARHD